MRAVLTLALTLILAFLSPALAKDNKATGPYIKQGQSTPLCKLLLTQAKQLPPARNLCSLPLRDARHGIGLPVWKTEPPTPELLAFIRKNLLLIYFVPIDRYYPGLSLAEQRAKAAEDLWPIVEPAFASGQAKIYSTAIDTDMAGVGSYFLALQTFATTGGDRPGSTRQPYFCDEAGQIPSLVLLATDFAVADVPEQTPIVLDGTSNVLFYNDDEFFVSRAKDWLYIDQVIFPRRESGKAYSGAAVCELWDYRKR